MGWEVQQYHDVQVIGHNGAVPGYTTGMFLVPEKDLAVALVMNTYSPMLGIRVSRLPSSVLRMLLDQPIIPGYEFLLYADHLRSRDVDPFIASHHRSGLRSTASVTGEPTAQHPTQRQVGTLHCLTANLECRYRIHSFWFFCLVAFDASLGAVILFQPDVGWVAVISGVFAIVWGLLRTSIVIAGLNKGQFRLSG